MTPSYTFDIDIFKSRIENTGKALPGIPLVYSIKANPFLIPYIPEEIAHIEVCSPGELAICKELRVSPEKIIYSGVMKEAEDVKEAVSYGAGILTAESRLHLKLIKEAAEIADKNIRVLFRLSSGNQFGMSLEDLRFALSEASCCSRIEVMGLHYYSGTAKNLKAVEKDIAKLKETIGNLRKNAGFICEMLEYGPGLASECFAPTDDECEQRDMELLSSVSPLLNDLGNYVNLSLEMGRFFAAPCGIYETTVKDIKTTDGVNYVIVDGGTHHLKYYGPNTAMKTPLVEHDAVETQKAKDYAICGALCITADVITRNISLGGLKIGDSLCFKRVGAYSVTEAPVLFLSRKMPEVCIKSSSEGIRLVRKSADTCVLNSQELSYE